jgi:hypothetical protein
VALTLAASWSAVIIHEVGFIGVSNLVGFDMQTLAIEGCAALLLAFVLGVPFLVARRDTANRRQPGHCKDCGYNLTGNVSGVCPECGTEIGKP